MSISIDVFDDVSPQVYAKRSLARNLKQLERGSIGMPRPLQDAIKRARYCLDNNNERNAARWVAVAIEVENLWRMRQAKQEICLASDLFCQGWRLFSDWPLRPHLAGSLVYHARLERRIPRSDRTVVEFDWSEDQDKRPLPIELVYEPLQLAHQDAADQELAWKVCFWLSFISEDELVTLATTQNS